MKRLFDPVVCFDLDDTLYPESQFVLQGLTAAALALEDEVGPVGALACMIEIHDREGPWHVFDSALAELGLMASPPRIARMLQAFRHHEPKINLHGKVFELLEYLRKNEIATAIITDGRPEIQRAKVAVLGLDSMVDHVVYAWDIDRAVHPKPDPAAYRHLAKLVGDETHRFLYVGDNPSKDFPAPDSLGWQTIRIRHPGGYHRDDNDTRPDRPVAKSIDALFEMMKRYIDGSLELTV